MPVEGGGQERAGLRGEDGAELGRVGEARLLLEEVDFGAEDLRVVLCVRGKVGLLESEEGREFLRSSESIFHVLFCFASFCPLFLPHAAPDSPTPSSLSH